MEESVTANLAECKPGITMNKQLVKVIYRFYLTELFTLKEFTQFSSGGVVPDEIRILGVAVQHL